MSKRIHNINRLVLAVAMMLSGLLHLSAQGNRTFEGKVFNSEFSMWLEMDFYGEGVKVPAQDKCLAISLQDAMVGNGLLPMPRLMARKLI